MPDHKGRSVMSKMDDQLFGDPDVRALLDEMPYDVLCRQFGSPHIDTHMDRAEGWTVGDGRPVLADEDPAVMQAVARCATARVRASLPATMLDLSGIHEGVCGWCDIPLDVLLAACAWSVWYSGHVGSETVTWAGANGSHYTRPGRHDVFTNHEHAVFWAMPRDEREALVQAAIEASR